MPVSTLTVSPNSPFIQYSADWALDSAYQPGSTASSTSTNSSVLLNFFGTAIYIYGQLDRIELALSCGPNLDGPFTETNVPDFDFDLLYLQEGLPANTSHQLYCNVPFQSDLILNNINITTGDGLSETTANVTIIENSETTVAYSKTIDNTSLMLTDVTFHGGTAALLQAGEYANISFYGNEMAIYGFLESPRDIGRGSYEVVLDGNPSLSRKSNPPFINSTSEAISNVLLYQTNGLSDEAHNVILTNTDANFTLIFDYATVTRYVRTSVVSSTLTSSTSMSSTARTSSARTAPVGTIAGASIGGTAFLLLTIAFVFIVLRCHSRKTRVTFNIDDSEEDYPVQHTGEDQRVQHAEEDMPPPEYRSLFPTLAAVSLPFLTPAWAGGLPRREREGVVEHLDDGAREPVQLDNGANLPHETPQRDTVAMNERNTTLPMSNAPRGAIERKAGKKRKLAGHSR